MSTLPSNIGQAIEWVEQRLPDWTENPGSIGLTAALVAELTTETTEARAAYLAAQAAKVASKEATITQNVEGSEMKTIANQLIKTIRAFAITQPDPSAILNLASVPPKKDPQSLPPEQPYNITYELTDQGALELKWKGDTQGSSTVYSVLRAVQLTAGGPYEQLVQVGLTGVRTLTDSSIPSCTVAAQYIVKAYKGAFTPIGSIPITVRFTAGGDFGDQEVRLVA